MHPTQINLINPNLWENSTTALSQVQDERVGRLGMGPTTALYKQLTATEASMTNSQRSAGRQQWMAYAPGGG